MAALVFVMTLFSRNNNQSLDSKQDVEAERHFTRAALAIRCVSTRLIYLKSADNLSELMAYH